MLDFKLQKPSFGWAFLFLCLWSGPLQAAVYEKHVRPLTARALDSSSQQILAAGVFSTWLASRQDNEVREQYRNHQTMSKESAQAGDRYGTYLVGPAIALGQYYFDTENGVSHIRGLVASTLVTHFLKETIRRDRPSSTNHRSMVSGHTSSAFTTATSLTYAYGWKAAAVAYPIATFVGLSRMADDAHWFSDVVAGAFVGVWMGRASFYPAQPQIAGFLDQISPSYDIGTRTFGLIWQTRF